MVSSPLDDRSRLGALLPTFGYGLGVGVLVLLAVLGRSHAREQAEAADWVAHTHEVITELGRIDGGLAAAESSLRGFALSSDERFLRSFEPAIQSTQTAMMRADALMADNAVQHARLQELKPRVARRVALLREGIVRVRGGEKSIREESQRLSQEIRETDAAMIATETALLEERSERQRSRTARMMNTSGLGLVASFAIVALAFVSFRRERGHRRELSEARRRANDERMYELTLLLELGELLQACRSEDDAFEMLRGAGPVIFEGASGSVITLHPETSAAEVRVSFGLLRGDDDACGDCWALRRRQPHIVKAQESSLRCTHAVALPPSATTYCFPLIAQGDLIGAFQLAFAEAVQDDLRRRGAIASEQLALALASLRLRDALRNESIRDPLTGLFNRRYVDETLSRELQRARRDRTALSVLALDVDFFKRINDTFGHDAGDAVLRALGALLKSSTRGSDVASRMGGEELLVLLPGADGDAATKKAEQLRAAVEGLAIAHEGAALGKVTVSIGVAELGANGDSAEVLLREADRALYDAKHGGRNRVVRAMPRGV